MKKLIRTCFVLFCAFFMSPSLTDAVSYTDPTPSYETETFVATPAGMEQSKGNNAASGAVEYAFPYPGMLTNHTFYFLKRFRDRIMESFMTDPLKKAEFHLLQSDKFMAMALTYEETNNWKYVYSSVLESLRTITQSAGEFTRYQAGGGTIPPYLLERIQRSIAKRRDVLYAMVQKSPDSHKSLLQKALDDSAHMTDDVAPLLP